MIVPEMPDILSRYGTVEPCPKGSMDQPDFGVSPRLFLTHWCPATDTNSVSQNREGSIYTIQMLLLMSYSQRSFSGFVSPRM
jgi:hypothetical protein